MVFSFLAQLKLNIIYILRIRNKLKHIINKHNIKYLIKISKKLLFDAK